MSSDVADKSWRPEWWRDDTHGSAWDRVRQVMTRDQAGDRAELHLSDKKLVRELQATAKEAYAGELQPSTSAPTPKEIFGDPTKIEVPLSYGYGARIEYGAQHPSWNNTIENKLRQEWEGGAQRAGGGWDDVKDHVRRGYDHDRQGGSDK